MSESVASRREFLKSLVADRGRCRWAAGTGVVRMAHAAGNDEIRVAVIGCGGRGAGAAANCLEADPAVKIVAIADAFQDRIETALNMLKGKMERIDVPNDRQFAGLEAYKHAVACDVNWPSSPLRRVSVRSLRCGHRGRQARLHGEAGLRRRAWFPLVMETNKLADEKALKVVVGLQRRHSKEFLAQA